MGDAALRCKPRSLRSFQVAGSALAAPETIKDSAPGNHESVTINMDVSQVRNDVVILGGIAESSNYTQVILGDAAIDFIGQLSRSVGWLRARCGSALERPADTFCGKD